MDLRTRSPRLEIMDTVTLAPAEMDRTLNFLALTNKWFGGTNVITRYLDEWIASNEHNPISILDVGTGGADIPLALVAWARRRHVRVRVVGLDLVPEIVEIARARTAREPNIEIRQGDLFRLAESAERFDVVTASLFLHHMPGAQALSALRAFDRLATRGVIVSDLVRSASSYCAVGLASYLFGNAIVRHDGRLSVERSFRRDELQALAAEAGLTYLQARREPWCRLSLGGLKA
jgi:2-polyprenyl-3-methyl-5-hydroxy-6-metoxy-1,4-benzoquinol methylase